MKYIRLIVFLVILCTVFYWVLVYEVGVPGSSLLYVIPFIFIFVIIIKFIRDNIVALTPMHIARSFPKAILAYVPITILIAPGITFLLCMESFAFQVAGNWQKYCEDKIEYIQTVQSHNVQKSKEENNSTWYKPWTWGDKVKVYYNETIQDHITKPVIHKAKLANKIIYGGLISALNFFVIFSRISLLFLIAVSFGYVYSMILLTYKEIEIAL